MATPSPETAASPDGLVSAIPMKDGAPTPGRWYAEGPSTDEDDYPNRDYWQIRYEHGPRGYGAEIARITSRNTGHEEANARLLAAAPSLLYFALDVIAGLEHAERNGLHLDMDKRSILTGARAAVARATGKETS
jgi:hypothetical protein